ncbi:MAG TPA: chemotaxis protein CheX [Bryobacteraceae bacterium]|nr:chemotaxis protein CheX [Bryobacteraceae bacterium]
MPEAQDADALVGALLESCCAQVLEAMFFSPVLGPAEPAECRGRPRVAALLHFNGKPSGNLEVDADPGVARALASSFLGLDLSDVSDSQVDEVIAEFANMTCGSALSSLGRVEYFHLETPVVSRPLAYAPAVEGVRRGFLLDGGTLSVCLRVEFGPEE